MSQYESDVLVLGAGAAGLWCAARAGQGGRKVILLDHSEKLAEKIRISGGGRCNFTNRKVTIDNFVSKDRAFATHALARFRPDDFIALVKRHRIPFHEKHKGQLFCDRSSEDIIQMLVQECQAGKVQMLRPHEVRGIEFTSPGFRVESSAGLIRCANLVVATGGLPIPKIGATDFGLKLARQFGLKVVEPRPALVPLTFDQAFWSPFADLSGVALPVRIQAESPSSPVFDEDLLFTHRGLSGPAILQASSHWEVGHPLTIDLSNWPEVTKPTPENVDFTRLTDPKRIQLLSQTYTTAVSGSRQQFEGWLAGQVPHWPQRLLQRWLEQPAIQPLRQRKAAELGKKALLPLAQSIANWTLTPSGTEGYKKAEVMRGGVATDELDPKTMQSKRCKGLYFIGEVVDMTGWLGGYNFQWAWSSAEMAARSMAAGSLSG